MRLSSRTAIAAGVAAAASLGVLGALFRDRVATVLRERVDQQLEDRAATAPILAAVGDRLAVSELGATVEGARIVYAEPGSTVRTVEIGALPDDSLPPVDALGFRTVRADGEGWRLYTVEVLDVPAVGDRTLVQLAAPLGDTDALARAQRRHMLALALATVAASAAVGYGFGALAARPLARLRREAMSVGSGRGDEWRIPTRYGAEEVDDVASVLNDGLDRIAEAGRRREEALESARAFAAAATHELRTPLTGAVTNLDLTAHPGASPAQRDDAIADARAQLRRVAATLTALRDLADADLADPSWFTPIDLADTVATVAATESRRHHGVQLEVEADDAVPVVAWEDGVRVAVSNLIRNALVHGAVAEAASSHDAGDSPPAGARVKVSVVRRGEHALICVEDGGPGIAPADRERLLRRFERGARSSGSGLGLALVQQIAVLHGGDVTLDDSPLGGARATLRIRFGGGLPGERPT